MASLFNEREKPLRWERGLPGVGLIVLIMVQGFFLIESTPNSDSAVPRISKLYWSYVGLRNAGGGK